MNDEVNDGGGMGVVGWLVNRPCGGSKWAMQEELPRT